MTPQILTTRFAQDAEADIAFFATHGIAAVSAPMLAVRHLTPNLPDGQDFDAIALTSRYALGSIDAQIEAFKTLPCFCVGTATAETARTAGFSRIITGTGTGAGLAAVIRGYETHRVLWLSGADIGFDLTAALSAHGIATHRLITYRAEQIDSMGGAVVDAISQGQVALVLVHSARAGAGFIRLIGQYGLRSYLGRMGVLALSPRVAASCGADWRRIRIAKEPTRRAMLEGAIGLMKGI